MKSAGKGKKKDKCDWIQVNNKNGFWLPTKDRHGNIFLERVTATMPVAHYRCVGQDLKRDRGDEPLKDDIGVTYRNTPDMEDYDKRTRAKSKYVYKPKYTKYNEVENNAIVAAVWVQKDWFETPEGLWLPITKNGKTLFEKMTTTATYKCVHRIGVDYRTGKHMDTRVKGKFGKGGIRSGEVVSAILVEKNWFLAANGLWLPIMKDGETLFELEGVESRRRLTVETRRLAEDDFANSHPFLVLFVSVFFVIYILAILIIDRLVTRAKRDAMQRGRKWNFSDCVKAWISKRLSAVTL